MSLHRGNLFLVGMMGAGKTTLGRQLARRLSKRFVDADHELEARLGVPIPTIFEIEGETGFRDREEAMIDELSQYDLITVFTKLDETSMVVKGHLLDAFKRLGIELVDLKFEGIDTEPQYRERLFWLKSGKATPSEVLRMETVKESAKELGKSSGAGLGSGMMIIPPLFQQPPAQAGAPAAVMVICPNCKAQVPSTSRFCPECGGAIAVQPAASNKRCPSCKADVSAGATFCPSCGKKMVAKKK